MRLSNGEVLLCWPLERHSLTAGMYYEDGSRHDAIDLASSGETVCAAEPGIVTWIQHWDGHTNTGSQSYGNAVKIRHADYNGRTLETLYAHLSRMDVQQGQEVQEGQRIAVTGSTGNSTGPHLHFEVRWGGKRYNPLCWLDDNFAITPGWKPYTYGKGEHPVQRAQCSIWGRGIDLSKHNWVNRAPVNFDRVRQAGARFVILRAGYGSFAHQVDPYFEEAYRQAAAAGLEIGAYWYSYAVTPDEARREAQLFAKTLDGKKLSMGLWFDQEYEPGILALTNARRTEIVRAFCAEAERLTGQSCGLYCSRDWINTKLDADKLRGMELWVAAYTGKDSPGSVALPWGIWQYKGSTGSWPGVDGPCDLNVCCKDYPALFGAEKEESENDMNMNWIELKNKRLKALTDKPACESFPQPDTAGPVIKIPIGDSVKVLAVSEQQYTIAAGVPAAPWYKVQMQAGVRYAIGLSDRWQLIDAPVPEPTPEPKPEHSESAGIVSITIQLTGKDLPAQLDRIAAALRK